MHSLLKTMNVLLPPRIHFARAVRFAVLGFLTAVTTVAESSTEKPASAAVSNSGKIADFFSSLLPMAWQTRPSVVFNAFTEMTPEGRLRRVPTPESPMYYYSPPALFKQVAEIVGGEEPPV